ncbi:GTP-binding protein [endosymbiont 'TC1' of Trimyema compressum]|uniref:GTP-binding protein n=1 Tax=endosymbiont 'TC1' of Trimyema compressum TaxID=243899 RepID=UPI000B4C8A1E
MPLLKVVGTKYDVQDILLEVSGIARPEKFLQDILKFAPEGMDLKIITLIDVTRWFILKQVIGELLFNQIKTGDLLIMNKIDSASEQEVQNIINDIQADFPDKKVIKMATDKEESIMAHYEEVLNG